MDDDALLDRVQGARDHVFRLTKVLESVLVLFGQVLVLTFTIILVLGSLRLLGLCLLGLDLGLPVIPSCKFGFELLFLVSDRFESRFLSKRDRRGFDSFSRTLLKLFLQLPVFTL